MPWGYAELTTNCDTVPWALSWAIMRGIALTPIVTKGTRDFLRWLTITKIIQSISVKNSLCASQFKTSLLLRRQVIPFVYHFFVIVDLSPKEISICWNFIYKLNVIAFWGAAPTRCRAHAFACNRADVSEAHTQAHTATSYPGGCKTWLEVTNSNV